jgi:hypothetical protein
MPNGRSGSLHIDKRELVGWLSGFAGTRIIGRALSSKATGRPAELSAEAVKAIVAAYPAERIAVEEHDRAAYVLHLYYPLSMDPPDPERWILIGSESPLFRELRMRHEQQGRWGAGSL